MGQRTLRLVHLLIDKTFTHCDPRVGRIESDIRKHFQCLVEPFEPRQCNSQIFHRLSRIVR